MDARGMATATYELVPAVRYRVIGDRAVIVHQERGEVLGLDGTGTEVLTLALGGRPPAAIAEVLEARYDAPGETIRRDVLRFLAELVEAGVLRRLEGGGDA